jgi:hypothetical protein
MVDRCPVYIPYPINLGLCSLGLGLPVVIRSPLVLLLVWIRTGGAEATVPLKLKLLPFVLVHGRSSPGSARRAEAGLQWWNKIRRLLLLLAGELFGASDRSACCVPSGSGAPDLCGSFGPSFVFVSLAGVDLGRYAYQLTPGWIFSTTLSGGLPPLLAVLSSGEKEILADMEASGLCSSGEVMARGHPQRPGLSSMLRYVDDFDMLRWVPTKNCDVSSDRGSASSSNGLLRSPTTSTTGMLLQGPECNFYFFRGCLCKIWVVIFQKNI